MPTSTPFLCPLCGRSLPATPADLGQMVPCTACGQRVLAAPAPSRPSWPDRRALRAALLVGLPALVLVVGQHWYLRMRQDARAAAWADQVVEAKLEAARAHLARSDWDEAVRLLQEAQATEHTSRA